MSHSFPLFLLFPSLQVHPEVHSPSTARPLSETCEASPGISRLPSVQPSPLPALGWDKGSKLHHWCKFRKNDWIGLKSTKFGYVRGTLKPQKEWSKSTMQIHQEWLLKQLLHVITICYNMLQLCTPWDEPRLVSPPAEVAEYVRALLQPRPARSGCRNSETVKPIIAALSNVC